MTKTHAVVAAALLLAGGALYVKRTMDETEAVLLNRLRGLHRDVSELSGVVNGLNVGGRLNKRLRRRLQTVKELEKTTRSQGRRLLQRINSTKGDSEDQRLRRTRKRESHQSGKELKALEEKIDDVEVQFANLRNMIDAYSPGTWMSEGHGRYTKQLPFAPEVTSQTSTPTYYSISTPREVTDGAGPSRGSGA